MFKRIFSSLALALTLASFLVPFNASAQASKSRLQKVQETGVLRVGTTGDFMPMSFRDPGSNEFRGHQIDAANELAKDMGVKVEFVVTDWKSIMTAVQSDKFDIAMTGTSMSVARAKAAAFSIPWGRNAFFPLVLKKDAAKFKSWEALNNPKVTAAYNLGTTMEQFVQTNMPKVKVKRVESPARDFQELLAGKADFMVASLIEGVPAFITDPVPQHSQTHGVANTDLSSLENPSMLDRQSWIERVAMCHWNFDELRSGEAWQFFKKYI